MKIIDSDSTEVIAIRDLTDDHIIVGTIDGRSVLLTQTSFESGTYNWLCLSRARPTANDCYRGDYASIADAINKIRMPKDFHAFHQWDEAVQWFASKIKPATAAAGN